MDLNPASWNARYQQQQIGWDIGEASAPLKAYFDQLTNKKLRILIPGAGNAYEAEYLFTLGFTNITVLDWATEALVNLKKRVPDLTDPQLIEGDFFEHEGQYDLIVEQTFFCAIDPQLRQSYVDKMLTLLVDGGKLVGVLFIISLNHDRPPYGGSRDEYLSYFSPYFDIKYFDPCYNSIAPRAGNELFIHLTKPYL